MRIGKSLLIVAGVAIGWAAYRSGYLSGIPRESPHKARPPSCLLWGNVKAADQAAMRGLDAIGQMIRLYFDADSVEECRFQIQAHCQRTFLDRGLTPVTLHASFDSNRDGERARRYKLGARCVLEDAE